MIAASSRVIDQYAASFNPPGCCANACLIAATSELSTRCCKCKSDRNASRLRGLLHEAFLLLHEANNKTLARKIAIFFHGLPKPDRVVTTKQ